MPNRLKPERAVNVSVPVYLNEAAVAKLHKVSKSVVVIHIDQGKLIPDAWIVNGWPLFLAETVQAWADVYRNPKHLAKYARNGRRSRD